MYNRLYSLFQSKWQTLALFMLPAVLLLFAFHRSFEEYDSYLYLSAVRENYLPGLGFGRMYFIKLFSWPLFIFSPKNIDLLSYLLKICNYILTIMAIGMLARQLHHLYRWAMKWCLFFSLILASSVPIAFYSFEFVTEPLTFFLLVLCIEFLQREHFSTKWQCAVLFLVLGVVIHCRESYLLLIPYFLIEWNKRTKVPFFHPLIYFSISALLPFIYQFLHKGSSYFDQINTAFTQTLQLENQRPYIILITLGVLALFAVSIALRKAIRCGCSHYSWWFILLPDLLHFLSGTLHPITKPRYYYISTITLAFLITSAFVHFSKSSNRLIKRLIYLLAGIILSINLATLIIYRQQTDELGNQLGKYSRIEKWQQASLVMGPLGMMLRATNDREEACFRVIENGWNWPKERLAEVLMQEIKYGFEVVIIPSLLTDYQRYDTQEALKKLSLDLCLISAKEDEIRIKPTGQHGSFTTIFTKSPNCWK